MSSIAAAAAGALGPAFSSLEASGVRPEATATGSSGGRMLEVTEEESESELLSSTMTDKPPLMQQATHEGRRLLSTLLVQIFLPFQRIFHTSKLENLVLTKMLNLNNFVQLINPTYELTFIYPEQKCIFIYERMRELLKSVRGSQELGLDRNL